MFRRATGSRQSGCSEGYSERLLAGGRLWRESRRRRERAKRGEWATRSELATAPRARWMTRKRRTTRSCRVGLRERTTAELRMQHDRVAEGVSRSGGVNADEAGGGGNHSRCDLNKHAGSFRLVREITVAVIEVQPQETTRPGFARLSQEFRMCRWYFRSLPRPGSATRHLFSPASSTGT